jgi:hypothetical protein
MGCYPHTGNIQGLFLLTAIQFYKKRKTSRGNQDKKNQIDMAYKNQITYQFSASLRT